MSNKQKQRTTKPRPPSRQSYSNFVELVTEVEESDNVIDLTEAVKRAGNTKRTVSAAWDESEALGIPSNERRYGTLSDYDRKDTLYQIYVNNTWISSPIDVIAKRIISGGMMIEEVEQGEGNEKNRETIQGFLEYINDDEDFLQLVESCIVDLYIYGECYVEIVFKNGVPWQLHKVDCQTITYNLDKYGHVTGYVQTMKNNTDPIPLDPDTIIRWWFPSPRASKIALSPIEKMLNPAQLYQSMMDWGRLFFRKGARPPFWIKYPGGLDDAKRFDEWLRENYTGKQNAHKPLIMYDEAELYEIGKGAIELDFLKSLDRFRDEFLAGLHTPPQMVGLVESAHLGGGTGESQESAFKYNVTDRAKRIFLEKLNYRILKVGFGIDDWKIGLRYADYRDDVEIAKIQDMRIRNGSATINEMREENGKVPYPDGGDVPVIVTTREITPVPRLSDLEEESRQNAEISIQTAQANADLAQTKADQAKEPPQPVPAPLQAFQQGQPPQPGGGQPNDTQPQSKAQDKQPSNDGNQSQKGQTKVQAKEGQELIDSLADLLIERVYAGVKLC